MQVFRHPGYIIIGVIIVILNDQATFETISERHGHAKFNPGNNVNLRLAPGFIVDDVVMAGTNRLPLHLPFAMFKEFRTVVAVRSN
jgi:hypothetical protein